MKMITVATRGKNTFKKGPEKVIKQIYQPAINSSDKYSSWHDNLFCQSHSSLF